MVTLPSVPETSDFWDAIEKEITRVFRKVLYLPLLREFGKRTLKNSDSESLFAALAKGRVTYYRGVFSGQFTADISRELRALGARWDRKLQCYRIHRDQLPDDVRFAISTSEKEFERKIDRIDERLARISPEELAEHMRTQELFDRSIYKMDLRVKKSMKRAPQLQVAPKISAEQRKRIASEWQNNMDLWITDFTKKEIKDLRVRLRDSVFAGNRYESAISTIKSSYGVTERKARFLASQETRLLLCKFKETRYAEAGVRKYKWKCVSGTSAHPVRPRHRALNDESQIRGKIFRFDQPPVTTAPTEPQRRNNPGEDYNCRCVAIPVVEF